MALRGCAAALTLGYDVQRLRRTDRLRDTSDRLAKPLALRKLSVARQYAAAEGWAFHLVTEKELLQRPLLSNVQLVGRYRQATTDPVLLQTIQRSVCEHGVPLADLCRQADQSDSTRARMHVFHLLAVGDLSFDPRQEPLSDQTLIYPGGAITWDPFDSVWAPNGCSTGGPLECGGSTPLSFFSQRSQLARFTLVRQHEPARTALPKRQLRRKENRIHNIERPAEGRRLGNPVRDHFVLQGPHIGLATSHICM